MAWLMAVLNQGLSSQEHADFVAAVAVGGQS